MLSVTRQVVGALGRLQGFGPAVCSLALLLLPDWLKLAMLTCFWLKKLLKKSVRKQCDFFGDVADMQIDFDINTDTKFSFYHNNLALVKLHVHVCDVLALYSS